MRAFVISHSFIAARDYVRKQADKYKDFTFVTRPEMLYGLRDVDLICVGAYWKQQEFLMIQEMAKIRSCRLVDEEGQEI